MVKKIRKSLHVVFKESENADNKRGKAFHHSKMHNIKLNNKKILAF